MGQSVQADKNTKVGIAKLRRSRALKYAGWSRSPCPKKEQMRDGKEARCQFSLVCRREGGGDILSNVGGALSMMHAS